MVRFFFFAGLVERGASDVKAEGEYPNRQTSLSPRRAPRMEGVNFSARFPCPGNARRAVVRWPILLNARANHARLLPGLAET